MPSSASSSTTTTLLAGVSVAVSVASLALSYRAWRRQQETSFQPPKGSVIVPEATLRQALGEIQTAKTELAKSDATIMELRTKVRQLKQQVKESVLAESKKHGSSKINGTNGTTNIGTTSVRATLENQILNNNNNSNPGLYVQPIGVVQSIYRLCVGTPRQGLLCPHARGRIELTLPTDAAMDAVEELENFSHVWILFVFHLNTLSKSQKVSPKIAPPALGGSKKVGVLATRSPHRFNPIGMTLAKLDRVEIKDKKTFQSQGGGGGGRGSRVVLHVSGLDLVDGTPVLDVKPYVPVYDSVDHDTVRLPPWVSEGLATQRSVTISDTARTELETILLESRPRALQFYGNNNSNNNNNCESKQEALENILACITEVLAIDVRSSWQTKKAREGNSQAERANRLLLHNTTNGDKPPVADTCTQQLDNLLLHYTVTEAADAQRTESEGSGAEDIVTVTSIQYLDTLKK